MRSRTKCRKKSGYDEESGLETSRRRRDNKARNICELMFSLSVLIFKSIKIVC